METLGTPPAHLFQESTRKEIFFDENNVPILEPNSRGKVRQPGTKSLQSIMKTKSMCFLNFIERCMEWDPRRRMTPEEALAHEWITGEEHAS
jgi:dual specificity tyrosine-phosphorylation-regulated kinase 2/3/4